MGLTGVIIYFYGDYVWPAIETNKPVMFVLISAVITPAKYLELGILFGEKDT